MPFYLSNSVRHRYRTIETDPYIVYCIRFLSNLYTYISIVYIYIHLKTTKMTHIE